MKSFIVERDGTADVIKYIENDIVVDMLKGGFKYDYATGDSHKEYRELCDYLGNKNLLKYYREFIKGKRDKLLIIDVTEKEKDSE